MAPDTSPSVASSAVALNVRLVPTKTRVPGAGVAIVTTGGVGVTVSVTAALLVAPSESVTAAVRVCAPSVSTALTVAPAPSAPSRLDVHWTARSRSKSSAAVAARVTAVPAGTAEPSAGAVMVTRGGRFGPRMRTVACACAARPSESATAAVIVCVPTWSDDAVTLGPSPSSPSRLEVQWIRVVRSPSSTSRAVPASVTGAPAKKTAPVGGAVMATVGGLPVSVSTSFGGVVVSRER